MRRVAFAIVGTIAGLLGLLSFKTHTVSSHTAPAAVGTTGPGATSSNPTPAPDPPSSPASSSKSSSSPSTASKTATGDAADTRWGPVQVKITVTNGKITSATAVEYPLNNPRDEQINAYAIPQLQQETIAANSADIDMVSGATYTSQGYLESLQSALDKVGR